MKVSDKNCFQQKQYLNFKIPFIRKPGEVEMFKMKKGEKGGKIMKREYYFAKRYGENSPTEM